MTSFRDPGDTAWNYMRPLPATKNFIRMIPRGADTFECMVIDGLPSKTTSNSDDPPGSYHTRDTFTPHPTITGAWRYLGRLDDRVTLINGEKVLPIPYEHTIRQHELVQEAVVFGVDRTVPGLMVVPSEKAASLSRDEVLKALLPHIELANSRAEEFGRVSPEMIEVLPAGTDYPRTDKGTVIRAAFYREFAQQIDGTYDRFARPQTVLRALGYEDLLRYLLGLFRDKMGLPGLKPGTDFFEAGVDSRLAITARAQITREIDVGGREVGSNVVFEYPTVERLARHLYSLRTGVVEAEDDEISEMAQLIQKYSKFEVRDPGQVIMPDGDTVVCPTHHLLCPPDIQLTLFADIDRCDWNTRGAHTGTASEREPSEACVLPRSSKITRGGQDQGPRNVGGEAHRTFERRGVGQSLLLTLGPESRLSGARQRDTGGNTAMSHDCHPFGLGRQLQPRRPQLRVSTYQGRS